MGQKSAAPAVAGVVAIAYRFAVDIHHRLQPVGNDADAGGARAAERAAADAGRQRVVRRAVFGVRRAGRHRVLAHPATIDVVGGGGDGRCLPRHVCVRPGDVLPIGHSMSIDLPTMLAGQLVLGAALAVIYSASLYFGMVLSDGSTSHGGYHEALIGVGSTVGPAVAAGVDVCFPGRPGFSIAAVAGLVAISFVSGRDARGEIDFGVNDAFEQLTRIRFKCPRLAGEPARRSIVDWRRQRRAGSPAKRGLIASWHCWSSHPSPPAARPTKKPSPPPTPPTRNSLPP